MQHSWAYLEQDQQPCLQREDRESKVGKFASPGDTAGQGVTDWQSSTEDQAISFEEIGCIPFCSEQTESLSPLSPSPRWFLRFRHLKDEREQEVNSAIL